MALRTTGGQPRRLIDLHHPDWFIWPLLVSWAIVLLDVLLGVGFHGCKSAEETGGNIHLQQGRYDRAIGQFKEAAAKYPGSYSPLVSLAVSYYMKKDYKEAVEYLYSLQKYGIKFGLSKTSNLLKAFKDPHYGQQYIHIAGTNGKGSVGAMIESILINSGLKVGFYCSPHLVRFTERFRVNQEEMPREMANPV